MALVRVRKQRRASGGFFRPFLRIDASPYAPRPFSPPSERNFSTNITGSRPNRKGRDRLSVTAATHIHSALKTFFVESTPGRKQRPSQIVAKELCLQGNVNPRRRYFQQLFLAIIIRPRTCVTKECMSKQTFHPPLTTADMNRQHAVLL